MNIILLKKYNFSILNSVFFINLDTIIILWLIFIKFIFFGLIFFLIWHSEFWSAKPYAYYSIPKARKNQGFF